jgi:hypothetical protein
MNDDQIRSELERRAGSAPSQPDWAKRGLLPAVWREVDARPQPVLTSGWPTGVGVAALVAALLVLVVAVPRLAPQAAGPSHSQSPLPTPTTPVSASGPTYTCTGPDWVGRSIELTDHLGVIESCVAARGASPDGRTVVSEISRGVVGISWQDSCPEGGASLDLWSREDAQDRPRYVLTIDSSSPEVMPPFGGCRAAIAGLKLELTFMNAELAPENLASDIEAHLMRAGRGTDGVATSAGEFHLTLSAGAAQYAADDPIDIEAQLVYHGPEPTIDLSGGFSLVNGFGGEQLDGDLELGAGWELPCVPHQLQSGEPLTVPFKTSASGDPRLQLPAGTWLVTAYSNFVVGTGCSGEPVHLQTSIVIAVGPPQAPIPTSSPPPVPSASPQSATRTFACAGSGALADSEITLIDHSGLIAGCSMTQRQSAQSSIEDLEITRTSTPNQLSAWWPVNIGCPADEQLEFWGPVDHVVGLTEYVLRLARQRSPQFDSLTCGDVLEIRQVQVDLTNTVQPEDVFPVAIDRWMADATVSSVTSSGAFDLELAAPQVLVPNEPIDITSMLSYHGVDPVTLSGWWQPDFAFVSLTGGPSFKSYGSILLCPDGEADMSPQDGISGRLQGGTELDPGDPNYAYREEYAYDGQFRLPAGAYLVYTGVMFNVGADCSGELVRLRNAIVIEVGLGSGGILGDP